MFEGWSYSQVLRVIGQSLDDRGVQDFSLAWQDGEFVVRGKVIAPAEPSWVDKVLSQKTVQIEMSIEIHYRLKSIVWLQIRGEAVRKDANLIPDYFCLSQTLRTVGSYIDSRGMAFVSLRRGGGTLFMEFQERSGKKRLEEHGMGSFENYFLRTYLHRRKARQA